MATDAISEALVSPSESSSQTQSSLVQSSSTSSTFPSSNGSANLNGGVDKLVSGPAEDGDISPEERIAELEAELERTREEREAYASQYRTLLSRIQTMKNTLGNKLKEDAEELDRREQTIISLNHQNEDLQSTLQTLQTELIHSNDESEKLTKELEVSRSRILEFEQSSRESVIRDRELRELREEAERLRLGKEDLEKSLQQERLQIENDAAEVAELQKELETEKMRRIRLEGELEKETERAINLQEVLEDFQAGKDTELRNAVSETQAQLESITLSLAEYKHRALQAELELENRASSADRIEKLEAELKEKSVLLGKLRHQNVILNEHLTEALRRLQRNSSDNNVDRRLVTNILISFLSTPRGDTKRFEMLSILSTILGWSEDDRERAGLQRNIYGNLSASSPGPGTGRKKMPRIDSSSSTGSTGVDTSESFSNMWVEFLMKEATQGQESVSSKRRPSTSGHSDSGAGGGLLSARSDISSPNSVYGKRIASLGSMSAIDLSKPPTGGGKKNGQGQEEKSERRLL